MAKSGKKRLGMWLSRQHMLANRKAALRSMP